MHSLYQDIGDHLLNLGFVISFNESTLYVKKSSTGIVIASLYVDGLQVTRSDDV